MTVPTRDSRATVLARAERDPEFVLAVLDELAEMTQEIERLRGLLREARPAIGEGDLAERIDAALGVADRRQRE